MANFRKKEGQLTKVAAMGASVLLIVGCGENASAPPEDVAVEEETALEQPGAPKEGVDPELLELWGGNYDVFHPETGVHLAILSIKEDWGRWGGQISLTKNFCQTNNPSRPTLCPFEGSIMTLGETEANKVALVTAAMDPFHNDFDSRFMVTMTSTDEKTVANIVLQADGGLFTIDGDFKKLDW